MSKKIVILNGSPRKTGNTSALVKAFTEGAESAGNTVTEFFLDKMDIHGCKGCFGGHSSQKCPCVQKDDMSQIYPAVKDCDVVVLASPLYYWTMSGQLRTALDRLFALEEGDGNLLRGNGKSSALLMAAEGHGFDDAVPNGTPAVEKSRLCLGRRTYESWRHQRKDRNRASLCAWKIYSIIQKGTNYYETNYFT